MTKLTIDGPRAVLQAKMTPALAQVLQRLEGQRAWLKAGGLSIAATGHNIEALMEAFPGLEVNNDATHFAALEGERKGSSGYLPTYSERTPSYAHQNAAKQKARKQAFFALFMEQGTGKTKVAIDLAGEQFSKGTITGVLVAAPKGVHRQWAESQIPQHCGVANKAQYWPAKELVDMDPGEELKFFCINIDAVKTPKGFKLCEEFIKSHSGKVLLVLDEAHRIKNQRSKSWIKLNELGCKVNRRLALTGTPIAKELTDEWSILKWLDERIIGIRYITSFRNEYCIMGGWEDRSVVGYRNIERFKEKCEPYTFRVTKEEVGILPKAYERWNFDLTKEQKSQIRQLKDMLLLQMKSGEIINANSILPSLLLMQQVSNGFVQQGNIISMQLTPGENPRIQAAKEWVEANDGKLVIWARFQQDIRSLKGVFCDEAVTYYGETSPKERQQAVEQFLDPDSQVRIFISTPSAGGTGLNLQGLCNQVLYYSNSENSIERWQSEDRVHRIGTNGIVTYTDLIGKGSLDAKILRNLRDKRLISDMALSEIKEWLDAAE